MALDLKFNFVGDDIHDEDRKDMLVSYYENNFHQPTTEEQPF